MIVEARPARAEGTPRRDQYVHLYGVDWGGYRKLKEIRGERPQPKIAYSKGTLELMTKSRSHERIKSCLGHLVVTWCLEAGVECTGYGEWTLEDERAEIASEPDECYVFGSDPKRKDRPDLVIEVVLTSGGVDTLDLYHALDVAEVWFWKKGRIQAFARRVRAYEAVEASECLPGLDLEELANFVDRPTTSQSIRDYREALRRKAAARSRRPLKK